MKLYYTPGACSLSPHIVLRESGLPFQLVLVDLRTKKTGTGEDYLQVNPNGYVPALQFDNGEVLTEGPAIVQWIADQKPESGLAPRAGTMERYRLLEWLNFITAELHKSFGALFNPATPEEWKKFVHGLLARRFETVSTRLQGKEYALGSQFTVVDAYLFTVLNWTGRLNVDISPWPILQQYLARVAARPKVQEAMRTEGLIK